MCEVCPPARFWHQVDAQRAHVLAIFSLEAGEGSWHRAIRRCHRHRITFRRHAVEEHTREEGEV